MKRLLCVVLSLCLLPTSVWAAPTSSGPELEAASAVLMEKETGTILYQQKPDEKLEPASVTKIMTLLLIFEALDGGKLKKEDIVTVSANAAGMGGSQVYLKEGEQMTVGELVKCITVVSGNDAAVAMAEHLAGTEGAFVNLMNQKAAQLGMTDTSFVNCTGLPAQGHLTTARDIALMSRELILNHPGIREYTTIWMDSIREGTFGLTNTNRLIRFYPGATGLKTGSTDGALYCMSATAERNGMELIAVVMKCPTSAKRFEDVKAMLDYGFSAWSLSEVQPETPLPPVDVLLGTLRQVQPRLSRPARLLLAAGENDALRTNVVLAQSVEAPVEQGQTIGTLEIFVGDELRESIPIEAAQEVPRLTFSGILRRMFRQLALAPH